MFDDIRLKNRCLAFNDQQDSFRFLQFTLQPLLRLPSGLVRFPWACGSQGSHPPGRQQKQLETRGWGECMLHLGLLGLLEVLLVDHNAMSVEGSQHNTSLSFSSPMLPAPCPVTATTHKLIHNGGDVPTFISFIQLPSAANL